MQEVCAIHTHALVEASAIHTRTQQTTFAIPHISHRPIHMRTDDECYTGSYLRCRLADTSLQARLESQSGPSRRRHPTSARAPETWTRSCFRRPTVQATGRGGGGGGGGGIDREVVGRLREGQPTAKREEGVSHICRHAKTGPFEGTDALEAEETDLGRNYHPGCLCRL